MVRRRAVTPVILVLLAAAGAGLLLCATRHGAGLMPDSYDYLSAADNLLRGNGLVTSRAGNAFSPYVLWPPLYPLAVALPATTGLPLTSAARWVGVLLFGTTVLFAGLAARQYTRSGWAGMLAGALIAACTPLLEVSSWVQSETLLIALALPALFLLDRFIESRRAGLLVAAALIAGLACLARNSGLAIVLTGLVLLLWKRRGRVLAIYLPLSLGPPLLWLARNLAIGTTGRTVLFHPPASWKLLAGLDTLASWFVSYTAAPAIKWLAGFAVLAVVLAFFFINRRARRGASQPPVPRALLVFLPCYLLVVLLSITLLDAFIPLDTRLLSPVLPTLVVLGVALGHRVWFRKSGRSWRVALVLLGVLWLGGWSYMAAKWIANRSRDGAWYSSTDWRLSPVLMASRDLPDDVPVWSNVPEAIWLITGRPASPVPEVMNHHTLLDNLNYREEIEALRTELARGALLVYIRREQGRRHYMPSEPELIYRLGLTPLSPQYVCSDGAIYTLGATQPSGR
jgi:hypothetical protein